MVMAGLVEVWLASLRCQAQLLLKTLAGYSSLQDAVELFGVDVERRFFNGSGRNLWRSGVLHLSCRSGSSMRHHRWGTRDTRASNLTESSSALRHSWRRSAVFLRARAHSRRCLWHVGVGLHVWIVRAGGSGSSGHGGSLNPRHAIGYLLHALLGHAVL